jgi:predicted porin
MKIIIMSALVLGVALPVHAETKTTLYGIAGITVSSQETEDANGVVTNPGLQVNSGARSSSRFGVKGSYDIRGELKAIYKLEGGVGIDAGSFSGFNRNSWVGLSGRYGAITAGLQWTPYDDAYYAIDAQQYAGWSAQYMVMNNTKGLGGIGSHGDTFSRKNSLVYNSPKIRGFKLGLMYAPGEDATKASESSRYSGAHLAYENGPLNLELSSESQRPQGASVTNTDALLVGGSYNAGFAKFYGGYQTAEGATGKDEGFSVGFSVPVRQNVDLTVGFAKDKTTNATGGVNNGVVKGLSADVRYGLASNLDLFALAASATGQVDGQSGKSSYREYGVGIRYKF